MEDVSFLDRELQGDTLDKLRELVTGSSQLDAKQQQKYIDNASVEELDAEIARLLKKKEELAQKLKETKRKTVKELVLDDLQDKIIKHKTSTFPDEVIEKMPIITKKRKLDLIKVTQAICGFTTFEQESELVIRLETCFEGYYYEHYQIYLELDRNQKLKVSHHTIPYFVPLDRIQKRYLNSNIKTFIHTVSDYLNCYVARRQQLMQLADCENVQFHRLRTSNPSDYVTVEIEHDNKKYHMQIYYESLLDTLPKKVDIVTLNKERQKQRVTHLYSFFLEHNLKHAFELAFPRILADDGDTTNQTDTSVTVE